MCHLEVMMTLAMRMYGDLVPFLFMIPLYHFLLLFFTIVLTFVVQEKAFVARLRFFLRYEY